MIRPGRRVKVDGLPVKLLHHLYWAGHGASRDRKGRSLRWIGPYYPGPDAGARQAAQIADANHESNIKICVLDEVQQNTSNQVDFSTAQMRGQEWTVTVYEYINEGWTRVTDRVGCTEIPEWNTRSHRPGFWSLHPDAVTEDEVEAEAPGETPPDGGGNDAPGDDDHPPDGEEKANEEEEIAEETQPEKPCLDPPEAGHETTYYANDSSCLAKDPEYAPW